MRCVSGRIITIDVEGRKLDADVDFPERSPAPAPHPPFTHGALAKYAHQVSSASEGAITSFPVIHDSNKETQK
jgi:dihydroxy-acid dehydratase